MLSPSSVLRLALAWLLLSPANSEIRDLHFYLEPDSTLIHFSQGYVMAPGYIDLGELKFQILDNDGFENFPDEFDMGDDMDIDDLVGIADDDGNATQPPRRRLADPGITMLDIAVVYLPASCANTRTGCDWTEFGIGARGDEGDIRYCCSTDAVELGLCEGGDKYGRLIVNSTTFSGSGNHRFIEIPPTGNMTEQIRYGKIEEPDKSGRFIVVFANCNDEGREVLVTGATVWKSKHGYLPGELFEFMYFYLFVTLVYFVLMAAFGICMNINAEARIDIEKWILMAIIMGLLETFFTTGAFFVWNEDGTQLMIAVYIGMFMGVLKSGISRCLIVMVSLGWGVVRDSLGDTLPKIIALGVFYCGVSSVAQFMEIVTMEELETVSLEQEDELLDVDAILAFLVFLVNVVFVLWILDALNGTMEYLESMNQTRKLMRYLRFRCIFLFAILFAVVWLVFNLVDTYDEDGILEEQHEWIVIAAQECNFLFLLVGVAILWWPNPDAKNYAYQMELPALGEGDDDGDNELELTGVVPSALDDEDDKHTNGNGSSFQDEFDSGFK